MENIINDEKLESIYIEKCKSREDCLNKLKELIVAAGLNVEFDIDANEAYLITENRKIKMQNNAKEFDLPGYENVFSIKVGNKLIGIAYQETFGMLDFAVNMQVIIKEGKDFVHYAFKQKYNEYDNPWFYYNDYINGEAHEFSSDGHLAHFRKCSIPMRSTYEILTNWGSSYRPSRFAKLKHDHLAFGGTPYFIGYKDHGRNFAYVPTVQSEVVAHGISEVHTLACPDQGPMKYDVTEKYIYSGKEDDGMIIPFYRNEFVDYFDEKEALKMHQSNDPELLDYCVGVLRMPENIRIFKENKAHLENQNVNSYIQKYFSRIMDGIEYYQKEEDSLTKTDEIKRELKFISNN